MRTRKPIQSKNTEKMLRSILPEDFKMVNDKTSNGYKFLNLLYGVEVDQIREYLQHIYDNSFLETLDLSDNGVLYDLYLSGLPNGQFLNTTVSGGVKIKITNWGDEGESEFWDGPPTRLIEQPIFNISGLVQSGSLIGLNYFRDNPSGYGYLLVNSYVDQAEYLHLSGSTWKINLDNLGNILESTGLWPGITTQTFEEQGFDDVLTPLGSGHLSRLYPSYRKVKDASGYYHYIDHYEPYLGWTYDVDRQVVAVVNYSGDYYYDGDGKKIWYRTAYNNPYGSGNYATEYIRLRNIPISGTLKLYDIDILDLSGNATEISTSGTTLYSLKSADMLNGSGEGTFDPIYVGYDRYVPLNRGFGSLEGDLANELLTTSWSYQDAGGYLDEGTMRYVEGSGALTNAIKIVNPYSRYVAEYKYKKYNYAKYVTSLEATRYLNLDTSTPIYSIGTVFNNQESLEFAFTKDPRYATEKSRFLTFDGWKIRPNSKISKIGFNVPILIDSGVLADFIGIAGRYDSIGFGAGFVPDISVSGRYTIIETPLVNPVSFGTVTEPDLTGSGNYFDWVSVGTNFIYRIPLETTYGKKIRYVSGSSYYKLDNKLFVKDNTFFVFKFRPYTQNELTLMELSEQSTNNFMKVTIKENGSIVIYSNGVEYYSRERLIFGSQIYELMIRYYPDQEYTTTPVFEIYLKESLGFRKLSTYSQASTYVREVDPITTTSTYIHIYKNCSIDAMSFKIFYETNYDSL